MQRLWRDMRRQSEKLKYHDS